MVVHDIVVSLVSGFFHLSHRPAKLSAPIRSADIARLLAIRSLTPFVIAARRNDAAVALEGIAEHWFVGDAFRASVEGRRQLLQRLFAPVRNETPAHWHQFRGTTIGELHDISGIGWSDVVVGLQISSGAREAVEIVDFASSITLSKSSTRDVQLSRPAKITATIFSDAGGWCSSIQDGTCGRGCRGLPFRRR